MTNKYLEKIAELREEYKARPGRTVYQKPKKKPFIHLKAKIGALPKKRMKHGK